MGPSQKPSAEFAIAMAGSLVWGNETMHIKKKER
jgi:hypothetical protein